MGNPDKFDKLVGLIKRIDARVERGFAAADKKFEALAGDITDISRNMGTKEQIIALHTEVNSIETQLRGMNHIKLEGRVADLEEKVFGEART